MKNELNRKITGVVFDLAYTQILDARRDAFRQGSLAIVERLTNMRNEFRMEFSAIEENMFERDSNDGSNTPSVAAFSEALTSLIDDLRREYVLLEDDPDGFVDRVLTHIGMSVSINFDLDQSSVMSHEQEAQSSDSLDTQQAGVNPDIATQNSRIINSFGYFARRLEDAIIDSVIPFIRNDKDLAEFSDRMLDLSDAISSQLMENYLRQMLQSDNPQPIDIAEMREATHAVFQQFEHSDSGFVITPINFDAHFPTDRVAYLRARESIDLADAQILNGMS